MKLAQSQRFWASFFFFLSLVFDVFAQQEVFFPKIGQIKVEGNTISSDRIILKNIRSRGGENLHPVIINEDVKRLNELGRFENVSIDQVKNGHLIDLIIKVKEKPVVEELRFTGNKKLKESDFQDTLKNIRGSRYDEASAIADKISIKNTYKEKGYLFSDVDHSIKPVTGKIDHVEVTYEIQENAVIKIADIKLNGRKHLPEAHLKKMMELRVDRFYNKGVFDSEKFAADLNKMQSYYQSEGFLDAKVKAGKSYFSENKKWLYLNIEIEEGRLYIVNDIQIEGVVVGKESEILERMSLKPGVPFSDYSRRLDMMGIQEYYGEIGRVFTRVNIERILNANSSHVDLRIKVLEGEEVYVKKIKIVGNTKTKDVVIRRELMFYPFERVNTFLIEESKRNLKNLGFFENNGGVEINYVTGDDPKYTDILVRVIEKETGSINFALGFSSVESIFASVRYSQRNFDWRDSSKGIKGLFTGDGYIGDGQNFSIGINTGTRQRRYTIDFSEPWVFNRKVRFGFGVYHTESDLADYYDDKQEGGYLSIGREFIKDLDGYLVYGVRKQTISDIDPNFLSAIRDQEGETSVSSLQNYWVLDTRDNVWFPTKGWYFKPSLTIAGGPLMGKQDFYKMEVEAKTYKKIYSLGKYNQHVLSGRLKLGYVEEYGDSNNVPIFERFFVGGLSTVRGFEHRALSPRDATNRYEVGGNFMTVFNLEYNIPISDEMLRAVLFYDMGNAFAGSKDFAFSDIRSSVGLGLRIQIPAMGPTPLALNFAKAVRKQDGDETESFSFNLGNSF